MILKWFTNGGDQMMPKCEAKVASMEYEIQVMQKQVSDIYLLVGQLVTKMERDEHGI